MYFHMIVTNVLPPSTNVKSWSRGLLLRFLVDNVMRPYFIPKPTCFTLLMLLKCNFVSPQVCDHNNNNNNDNNNNNNNNNGLLTVYPPSGSSPVKLQYIKKRKIIIYYKNKIGTSSPLRDVVKVWKRLHVKFQSADVFPKSSASAVSFKKLNRLAFAKGNANAVSFKMKLFRWTVEGDSFGEGSVNWFECVSYLCRKDMTLTCSICPQVPRLKINPSGSNFIWYYLLDSLSSQTFPLR